MMPCSCSSSPTSRRTSEHPRGRWPLGACISSPSSPTCIAAANAAMTPASSGGMGGRTMGTGSIGAPAEKCLSPRRWRSGTGPSPTRAGGRSEPARWQVWFYAATRGPLPCYRHWRSPAYNVGTRIRLRGRQSRENSRECAPRLGRTREEGDPGVKLSISPEGPGGGASHASPGARSGTPTASGGRCAQSSSTASAKAWRPRSRRPRMPGCAARQPRKAAVTGSRARRSSGTSRACEHLRPTLPESLFIERVRTS